MRVLVIDTALDACTAAVFEDAQALAVRSEPMSKGHQERIAGLVRDVVAEAADGGGGGFEALDRIGVTVGPGSFTGLRVGLAFAQGLGAALGVPVVGISTLAALARSRPGQPGSTVAAAIDARRGQVYLQTFSDGIALTEPEAVGVDALTARMVRMSDAGFLWQFVGSGSPVVIDAFLRATEPSEFRPDYPDGHGDDVTVVPTPEALAALTLSADPDENPPRPLYLRAPDATPPTRLPGQPRMPPAAKTVP